MLTLKGVRGFYVGWERYCDEPRVVSKAWFRELADPWRIGGGWRLRIGHKAIQVGRYRLNTEGDMSALKQLGGRELPEFDPAEIGAWRGPGAPQEPPPAA